MLTSLTCASMRRATRSASDSAATVAAWTAQAMAEAARVLCGVLHNSRHRRGREAPRKGLCARTSGPSTCRTCPRASVSATPPPRPGARRPQQSPHVMHAALKVPSRDVHLVAQTFEGLEQHDWHGGGMRSRVSRTTLRFRVGLGGPGIRANRNRISCLSSRICSLLISSRFALARVCARGPDGLQGCASKWAAPISQLSGFAIMSAKLVGRHRPWVISLQQAHAHIRDGNALPRLSSATRAFCPRKAPQGPR